MWALGMCVLTSYCNCSSDTSDLKGHKHGPFPESPTTPTQVQGPAECPVRWRDQTRGMCMWSSFTPGPTKAQPRTWHPVTDKETEPQRMLISRWGWHLLPVRITSKNTLCPLSIQPDAEVALSKHQFRGGINAPPLTKKPGAVRIKAKTTQVLSIPSERRVHRGPTSLHILMQLLIAESSCLPVAFCILQYISLSVS